MKRFGNAKAVFCGLVLSLVVMAGKVIAVPAEEAEGLFWASDSFSAEASFSTVGEEYPDNEELFAQFVDVMFYGSTEEQVVSESARDQLPEDGKVLYDYFKPLICAVARGESTSTNMVVSAATFTEWKKKGVTPGWTAQELGFEKLDGSTLFTATDIFEDKIVELIGDYVWKALMHDCPYELYWHDKSGAGLSLSFNYELGDNELLLNSLTLKFQVAKSYRKSSGSSYVTDATKTGATSTAVQNARAIVAEHQAELDFDKLKSYCDDIQALSTYNHEAVKPEYTGGYGDPWQMIYVFDNDPETKVVCEGFSKAFQYLCDASEFQSDKVACYTVSGTLNGGGHMWNTVTMENGKNYLVDVTNHEGAHQDLFMVGTQGTVTGGYPFVVHEGINTITFIYYDETIKLWGDSAESILYLATSKYSTCTDSHKYSDHWTVVYEPTQDSTGLLVKECIRCGHEQEMELPYLKFKSISVTLHSNLAVSFKVLSTFFEETGYENPYVVFRFNGKETRVDKYTTDAEGYLFQFRNIAPNKMNDIITATVYAEYDGRLYEGRTIEYSIAEYCINGLVNYTDASYAEIRTLLVDLLNYGAAAQVYTGYETSQLANASLTSQMKSWASETLTTFTNSLNSKYVVINNPTAKWKSVSLLLEDAVTIRYKIATEENLSNLTVKITGDSGKSWTIPGSEFVATDDGYYAAYFSGLNAGEMSEPVNVTVYKGNKAISNTLRYSIESYVYANQSTSDQALKDLILNMMKYGNSAYAYVH